MNETELNYFKSWALLPKFHQQIDLAKTTIRQTLLIGSSYISCSWGKDSIALAHLVHSISLNVPIYHNGCADQDSQDNYSEVARSYLSRFPAEYLQVETDGRSLFGIELADTHPVCFLGLRAEESNRRKLILKKYGVIHQYQSGKRTGLHRSCPLAWWSWSDVWAYIVAYDLPYLSAYDNPVSGSKRHSRTSVIHDFDSFCLHNAAFKLGQTNQKYRQTYANFTQNNSTNPHRTWGCRD